MLLYNILTTKITLLSLLKCNQKLRVEVIDDTKASQNLYTRWIFKRRRKKKLKLITAVMSPGMAE